MSKRHVLVSGLVLAVLAGASLAALALRERGEEPSVGAPETNEGPRTSTTGASSETSTAPSRTENAGPIRFVLADRYVVGETVDVQIENVGGKAYLYQWPYQACFLTYLDSSGRRFIIPPGTHCDLRSKETITPGERTRLFTWNLDECIEDQWGCVESRLLPPGTYTIEGRFAPKAAGTPVRVETTFTIVAA